MLLTSNRQKPVLLHPTMHKTASSMQSYPTQNINSVEAEQLWGRGIGERGASIIWEKRQKPEITKFYLKCTLLSD